MRTEITAPNVNADLIAEIDAFCAETGLSVTAFGARALNDPGFYAGLGRGRDCRRSTVARLRAFMAAQRGGDAGRGIEGAGHAA